MKTNLQEMRQILAQVNDLCLAFVGHEKYDFGVDVVNFEGWDEERQTGISVFIHGKEGIVEKIDMATYYSEDKNYAALERLQKFVDENTEG